MGVETFSWERYFNRIRNYPLTTAGAAHDAGATIHAPVTLILPLQHMKSSPHLPRRIFNKEKGNKNRIL